jgi:hypothetical protein
MTSFENHKETTKKKHEKFMKLEKKSRTIKKSVASEKVFVDVITVLFVVLLMAF